MIPFLIILILLIFYAIGGIEALTMLGLVVLAIAAFVGFCALVWSTGGLPVIIAILVIIGFALSGQAQIIYISSVAAIVLFIAFLSFVRSRMA